MRPHPARARGGRQQASFAGFLAVLPHRQDHRRAAAAERPDNAREAARQRGRQESELATRRRSDPGKLASAARLRSETTLPIKWIAARVRIGTAKGAKSVLPHLAQSQDQRKTASALEPSAQLVFGLIRFDKLSCGNVASSWMTPSRGNMTFSWTEPFTCLRIGQTEVTRIRGRQ